MDKLKLFFSNDQMNQVEKLLLQTVAEKEDRVIYLDEGMYKIDDPVYGSDFKSSFVVRSMYLTNTSIINNGYHVNDIIHLLTVRNKTNRSGKVTPIYHMTPTESCFTSRFPGYCLTDVFNNLLVNKEEHEKEINLSGRYESDVYLKEFIKENVVVPATSKRTGSLKPILKLLEGEIFYYYNVDPTAIGDFS